MKLLTLNVEGILHKDTVLPYLLSQRADVICLQEADQSYALFLEKLSYTTTFLPRCIKVQNGISFVDGVILASLHPTTFTHHYYYKPSEVLAEESYDAATDRKTNWQGLVLGSIEAPDGHTYTIGTTHFTWTQDGSIANDAQVTDMQSFLSYTAQLEPHIMCGDFNIPRNHNRLYPELIKHYTDSVPAHYGSSLDKSVHRHGGDPTTRHMFTDYMVDYIFTQPPYEAEHVELVFGLSDHAAVVADIHKQKS